MADEVREYVEARGLIAPPQSAQVDASMAWCGSGVQRADALAAWRGSTACAVCRKMQSPPARCFVQTAVRRAKVITPRDAAFHIRRVIFYAMFRCLPFSAGFATRAHVLRCQHAPPPSPLQRHAFIVVYIH